MTSSLARCLAFNIGEPNACGLFLLAVIGEIQPLNLDWFVGNLLHGHRGVKPFDVPGYIRTPNADDYLYRLQVAIPRIHALVVVVLIEIHFLRVTLLLDRRISVPIELEKLIQALFCAVSTTNSTDNLVTVLDMPKLDKMPVTLGKLLITESEENAALVSIGMLVFDFPIAFYRLAFIITMPPS